MKAGNYSLIISITIALLSGSRAWCGNYDPLAHINENAVNGRIGSDVAQVLEIVDAEARQASDSPRVDDVTYQEVLNLSAHSLDDNVLRMLGYATAVLKKIEHVKGKPSKEQIDIVAFELAVANGELDVYKKWRFSNSSASNRVSVSKQIEPIENKIQAAEAKLKVKAASAF